MTTHGRGGIDRVISGSVADKVVRGATTPVVVVPLGATIAAPEIEDVLAPLDGSEFAARALPRAVALAQATGATLRLVRVVEPVWSTLFVYGDPMGYYLSDGQLKEMQDEADRAAGNYLTAVAAKLSADLPRVTTSVYHGRPADELLRSAALYPHGLMVMATHGRGGLRRFALGSVTTELLQRSALPLMVVPSSASASS
jgi:nucleotide-binding universal stress UspA family protein